MGAVRAERFCDGALKEFVENGSITKWLERLKEIDKCKLIIPELSEPPVRTLGATIPENESHIFR